MYCGNVLCKTSFAASQRVFTDNTSLSRFKAFEEAKFYSEVFRITEQCSAVDCDQTYASILNPVDNSNPEVCKMYIQNEIIRHEKNNIIHYLCLNLPSDLILLHYTTG
jgi:hypothetical protein